MNRLLKSLLSRTSLLSLPFSLFAVVSLGQNELTNECKGKDYLCRYNNYMHIVVAKCVKAKVYDYDCFVAEQTKIVEANPNDLAAYFYRGITYSPRDSDRAIADFNRVLELDQLYEPVYMHLASAFIKKGDYVWALTFLNRGIELFPQGANIYEFRGYTYLGQRQFDKALAEYDKAIGVNPRGWRDYYDRGFIYWKRGEKAKAEADCQKAKELKPFERPRRFPPEHISNEYCSL